MRKKGKSKLMPILMTLMILLSVIVLFPQSTLAAPAIDEISKTDDLTCGEEIWVNASGLTPEVQYYLFVGNETGDWGDNVGDDIADDDGEISLEINVPYRNPLGGYNLSLHSSATPTAATQNGTNVTLCINNTFKVRYKSGTEYLAYAVYNQSYKAPNAFEFYVYNWTGSEYELYEDEITITLYDPSGDLVYNKTTSTSTGKWDIDYTFDSDDDDPNFEVKYWLNVTDSADANEYSNATLPVKFNVTAELPSAVEWGDTITISGYVKDGNGDGIGGYTVKLYTPTATGYQEMDTAVTYSSGRYSLSASTDDGSAGTWYFGTFDDTASFRIDTPDKFVASADGFIPYHSIDVASDTAIVTIVSPDEIELGIDQTINISIYNSFDDRYYNEMWVHVTGIEANYSGTLYEKDEIITIGDFAALGTGYSSNEEYAYYEFTIKFEETGTGTILVTHPLNISAYENYEDLEANITGSKTFTVRPINHPPYIPSNPSPEDNASNVSVDLVLSWTGGDPDSGDTVTYDIYFGTSSPPPKVVNNQTDTSYDPGTIEFETAYFWQIVAWDSQGLSTSGQIWHFTTELEPNQPPDKPSIDGPTSGKAGEEYDCTFSVVDPNDDDVYYYVQWGDGTNSSWIGPYSSGEEVTIGHTWSEQDTYTITIKVKDVDDAQGPEATLEVTILASQPDLAIPIGTAIALGGGSLATVDYMARIRPRKKWQKKAREKKPKKTCQPCTHYCHKIKLKIEPTPFTLKHFTLNVSDPKLVEKSHEKKVKGKVVNALNKVITAYRRGNKSEKLKEQVAFFSAVLLQYIRKWLGGESGPRNVSIIVHLEGGKVNCQFILYHCKRIGNTSKWVEERKWKATVKEEHDKTLGTLRGFDPSDPELLGRLSPKLAKSLIQFIEKFDSLELKYSLSISSEKSKHK